MEQLGTILRALCLGLCVCGLGIGVLVAVFLGFTGGGIITAIKDILGIGQRDEDQVIDEAMSSIQQHRSALKNKRDKIVGPGGVPDFDAAVAKYAQNPDSAHNDSFSAQSLDPPGSSLRRSGSGNRFDNPDDGLRGKHSSRDDEYEIYDDGDFFEG